jgi:hypothetical protein
VYVTAPLDFHWYAVSALPSTLTFLLVPVMYALPIVQNLDAESYSFSAHTDPPSAELRTVVCAVSLLSVLPLNDPVADRIDGTISSHTSPNAVVATGFMEMSIDHSDISPITTVPTKTLPAVPLIAAISHAPM